MLKNKTIKKLTLSLTAGLLLCVFTACGSQPGVQQAEVYVKEEADKTADPSGDTAVSSAVSGSSLSFAELLSPDTGSSRPSVTGDSSSTEILPATASDTASSGSADTSTSSAAQKTSDTQDTESTDKDYIEILFLGDSQYTNVQGTGTEIPALVAGEVDPSQCKVYNLAISGSCASLQRSEKEMQTNAWTSSCFIGMAYALAGDVSPDFLMEEHPSIAQTLKKIDPKKIDYIVIDYGTNDFLNARPLSDEDEPDNPCCFSGAYDAGLWILQRACPDALIICCSPCYSAFYAPDGAYKGDGNSLDNGYGVLANYVGIVDALTDYHKERTCFMDMYHADCIDLDFYSEKDYLSDGIHLTARGRRAYAAAVGRVINRDRGTIDSYGDAVRIGDF